MKPQTIGRALGIGIRVAGKVAGQRIASAAQTNATEPSASRAAAPDSSPAAGASPASPPGNFRENLQASIGAGSRNAGRAGGLLARGVGGFLRPFGRVGGTLWLEVSGVFFLLPVVVFTPTVWHARTSWLQGPEHRTFWVSAVVVLIFFYLGISSFWRARRR